MTILESLQILLPNAAVDVLTLLISMSQSEAVSYCHLDSYDAKLDYIIIKMVTESYNKVGNEGISSQSFSGVDESYIDGYSADIISALNSFRKLLTL